MPHDHGIKCEFVSDAKSVVVCTTEKRILCWSIFAIEPISGFLGYWPSESGSHDAKGNLLLIQIL